MNKNEKQILKEEEIKKVNGGSVTTVDASTIDVKIMSIGPL